MNRRRLSLLATAMVGGCWSDDRVDDLFVPEQWAGLQQAFKQPDAPDRCPPGWATCDQMRAFGRTLFFDPMLSVNGTVSCASCHDQAAWFIDSRTPNNVSASATGFTKRNAMSLVNVELKPDGEPVYTWIGAYNSAGAVLDLAITKAMGSTHAALAQTIRDRYSDDYRAYFGSAAAASDDVVFENVETVFDAYFRSLVSLNAPIDRWIAGDETAVDDSVKRGFAVFVGRGLCADCHRGGLFTDLQMHTTGVPQTGLHVVADPGNAGAFLTPGLRNVAQTGPYMHDGVFATLTDVIAFYRRGGDASDVAKDPRIVPLDISDADAGDLLAFLNALTGDPIPQCPPTLVCR